MSKRPKQNGDHPRPRARGPQPERLMKRRHVGVVVLSAIALASCATWTSSRSSPAVRPAYPPQPPVVADPSVAPSSQPRTCERQTLIGTVSVQSVTARDAPADSAHEITSFTQTNAQGAHQVFDLLGQVTGRDGEVWYRALLPLRPNGTTGFIPAQSLRLSQTLYRLEVDRLRLKLTLWNGCQIAGRYPIGLGTQDTPTPVGTFYLVALVKPPTDGSVYGTYAYGPIRLLGCPDQLDGRRHHRAPRHQRSFFHRRAEESRVHPHAEPRHRALGEDSASRHPDRDPLERRFLRRGVRDRCDSYTPRRGSDPSVARVASAGDRLERLHGRGGRGASAGRS